MPRRPTVLLFDLDGTLLLTGGAGSRAFAEATQEVLGDASHAGGFSYAGMTDRSIAREVLRRAQRAHDEAEVDRLIATYLPRLAREVRASAAYRVLDGVEALLERLAPRAGGTGGASEAIAAGGDAPVALGLGTGNVEEGARTKLARGDLNRHFAFGGFGCDAEDRADLLRAGVRRGAARLGVGERDVRVVVIGDTEKDVAAALRIGAVAVGVGTGPRSPDELRAVGAHHAFDTLAAPGVFEALLDGP